MYGLAELSTFIWLVNYHEASENMVVIRKLEFANSTSLILVR